MLMGERVDVVSYHPDPERFLINALAVSPLSVVTTEDGTVVVTVPKHQLAAARGGGNLNVVLASRLCGVKVQVLGA
jgi:N utilization substance protein A